jgi:hypothetical protein
MEMAGTKSDPLTTFCKVVISRHNGNWPITEKRLAQEFIEYFDAPHFVFARHISEFGQSLNIKVLYDKLPMDLFGANFTLAAKRLIVICDREDRVVTRSHTFLHELRELLENEFRLLGFPCLDIDTKEDAADEFARSVALVSNEKLFRELMQSSMQLDKTWQQVTACTFVVLFQLIAMVGVGYSSIYPLLEGPSTSRLPK